MLIKSDYEQQDDLRRAYLLQQKETGMDKVINLANWKKRKENKAKTI